MQVIKLLDRPIAFHRCLVDLTGSIEAALMLSQAIYWAGRTADDEGWFYKTIEDWAAETGMSRTQQDGARRRLRAAGFWFEERRGDRGVLHFRIDAEKLEQKLEDLGPSSLSKTRKRVCRKPANAFVENLQTRLQETDKRDCGKPANAIAENLQTGLSETDKLDCRKPANAIAGNLQTLIGTEITTETTTETTAERAAAGAADADEFSIDPALAAIEQMSGLIRAQYSVNGSVTQTFEARIIEETGKLNGMGCTPDRLEAFFRQRSRLPSLNYLAMDWQAWAVNERRAAEGLAEATGGGNGKRQQYHETHNARAARKTFELLGVDLGGTGSGDSGADPDDLAAPRPALA